VAHVSCPMQPHHNSDEGFPLPIPQFYGHYLLIAALQNRRQIGKVVLRFAVSCSPAKKASTVESVIKCSATRVSSTV
jgi:hypothetical protein